MNSILLDVLAISAIVSGVLVITSNNPVVSVLFLIATFGISACYLLMLGVGFVGISYLIVYVGAIAVLFLFVVMMLNIRIGDIVSVGQEYTQGLPLGFIVGSIFFLELMSVIPGINNRLSIFNWINSIMLRINTGVASSYNPVNLVLDFPLKDINHVQALGTNLYGNGSIWLIITSLILLLAMLGPIVLCMRR